MSSGPVTYWEGFYGGQLGRWMHDLASDQWTLVEAFSAQAPAVVAVVAPAPATAVGEDLPPTAVVAQAPAGDHEGLAKFGPRVV